MATSPFLLRVISKFRYWCILQTYYVGVFFGTISLKFDFKTRKFYDSNCLCLYTITINIIVLLLAPVTHWNIVNSASFYIDNLQMKLINSINLSIRTLTAIASLMLRWQGEPEIKRIVERLILLEEEYFKRVLYPGWLITKCDRLFFVKFSSVWLQLLAGLFVVYRFVSPTFPWWHVTFIYTVITTVIFHGVILHFYMCLLHIVSRFSIINYNLGEIYQTVQKIKSWTSIRSQTQMQKALAAEIDSITYIHCNLTNVAAKLTDCYKFQILILLASHVFNNIAMGYYDLMMCKDYIKFNLTIYDFIIGGCTYFWLILDLYLFDINCSALETSYETTYQELKQFCELQDLEASLNRSCESLSLHLAQKKLYVTICGFFNLNKKTSFVICAYTLSQVLFLIQNDMANSIPD